MKESLILFACRVALVILLGYVAIIFTTSLWHAAAIIGICVVHGFVACVEGYFAGVRLFFID